MWLSHSQFLMRSSSLLFMKKVAEKTCRPAPLDLVYHLLMISGRRRRVPSLPVPKNSRIDGCLNPWILRTYKWIRVLKSYLFDKKSEKKLWPPGSIFFGRINPYARYRIVSNSKYASFFNKVVSLSNDLFQWWSWISLCGKTMSWPLTHSYLKDWVTKLTTEIILSLPKNRGFSSYLALNHCR